MGRILRSGELHPAEVDGEVVKRQGLQAIDIGGCGVTETGLRPSGGIRLKWLGVHYSRVTKATRHEETIDGILDLGQYAHHKVYRLLQAGFLAIHLGVHAPNVILYAGLMSRVYEKERDDAANPHAIFVDKTREDALEMKKAFDRGERSEHKMLWVDRIRALESYLKKSFPRDKQ